MATTGSRSDVERHVSNLALTFGWHHHHARCPGLTRGGYVDGFPSETLVRAGRLVFISIASAREILIPPEEGWVAALECARAVEIHVAHASDLGALTRTLSPAQPERR